MKLMPNPGAKAEDALIENILGSGVIIPPQPKILLDIEQMLANNAGMAAIAKRVSQDAALTASVFKVISSPVYGSKKPANNLEKAISVIGLNQMLNIIKSSALRRSLGGQEEYYEWFWEGSAEIAQLCSIIAWKQRSVCNIFPDQAYMAGLFHDCGVPILLQRFDEYCKVWRQSVNHNWPDLAAEDRQFNTNHCVVGYLIAKHWHLPDYICQAVRFHHEILNTGHKATTMVAMLQLATHIHNIYSHREDHEWESVKPQVLEEVGINEEGLKEFEEEIYDTLKSGQ